MNLPSDLYGTRWTGVSELWLDPLGNEAQSNDCTMALEAGKVSYTWSYEGQAHQGSITLTDNGADFTDTWHQPEPMRCSTAAGAGGLFQVEGRWGPESDWGWRIGLSLRPTGELVLQMTNITPWGEEARAVRMICQRQP
jgi:hypothetical protein